MKILTPVKNLYSWLEIIKAWTDEIYFWVVSNSWKNKYWFKDILNRRDSPLANISSYQEAKKLIDHARDNNVKSYITLNNSPIIVDEKKIKEEIENCISIKPDALIIKDIYIADLVRKIDKNIDIHCSSLNQVLNSESIKYWVDNFSISRMIFPRNISSSEIKKLCNMFPELEFEIFIKNGWCYNTDWICSSLHLEWLKEWIPYVCARENNYKTNDKIYQEKYNDLLSKRFDCKICILHSLKDIKNLVSLKIVWREKNLESILKDLLFVKKSLLFLALCDNSKEFLNFNIKSYNKILWKKCWYNWCEYFNKIN